MTVEDEQTFPSTTFGWRYVKIARPPEGQKPVRRSRSFWRCLGRRDPKLRQTITIRFRGGNELWYHVEARGRQGAVTGWYTVHDMMTMINNDY